VLLRLCATEDGHVVKTRTCSDIRCGYKQYAKTYWAIQFRNCDAALVAQETNT